MLAAKSFIQNSYGASCYCGQSCSFHASVVIAAVVNIIITDVVVAIVMVIFIGIMKIMPAKDVAFAHCPVALHCPYCFRVVPLKCLLFFQVFLR